MLHFTPGVHQVSRTSFRKIYNRKEAALKSEYSVFVFFLFFGIKMVLLRIKMYLRQSSTICFVLYFGNDFYFHQRTFGQLQTAYAASGGFFGKIPGVYLVKRSKIVDIF